MATLTGPPSYQRKDGAHVVSLARAPCWSHEASLAKSEAT
jgi:hypothetical protein